MSIDLLDRVLAPDPPAFALLHRPEATGPDELDLLLGTVSTVGSLAAIEVPALTETPDQPHHDVLALVPFRQVAERGFAAPDDGAPLLSLAVTDQERLPVDAVLRRLPNQPIDLADVHFDVADDEYAQIVRRIISDEIGTGEGANFVIKRSLIAEIGDYGPASALSFFRRLLARESGAYWTFVIHTGEHTFVGASPERHVSLRQGSVVMNPISGTYRYPHTGPELDQVMDFLADQKETDELAMVVDEELKMMARICPKGGRMTGPYLREMARLAHTEYFIEGRSGADPRDILHETLFAPTVTGSPLESACRVITRYEPQGRGYYSGVVALIGRDAEGGRALDSSILIRTADIDRTGRLEIGVGATLVRHSDPLSEVAETRAKTEGLLAALTPKTSVGLGQHPSVRAALEQRNAGLADFWQTENELRGRPDPALVGRRVLVVDAEDTFTSMLDQQLRSTGLDVRTRRFDQEYDLDGHDLVVLGPGPGDPRDLSHPKIAHLRAAVDTLLERGIPFLAVCLSHQVLSSRLGFDLCRRDVPNQGIQREIDLFGRRERVGFYNSFAARSDRGRVHVPDVGPIEVSREHITGEVHALRGPQFVSMQFHAESVLTMDGVRIVSEAIAELLVPSRPAESDQLNQEVRTQ